MVVMLAILQAAVSIAVSEAYTCEYLRSDSSKPHEPPRGEFILNRLMAANGAGERWTVEYPGSAPAAAEPFPAEFGSVGGSTGIRWTKPDGKIVKAFVSFSDMEVTDGSKGFWLSIGHPSLWQPPGYLCGTPPLHPSKVSK